MQHCKRIPASVQLLGADENTYKTLPSVPLAETAVGHQHRCHTPQQRTSRGLKHQGAVTHPSSPSAQPSSPSPHAPLRGGGDVPEPLICSVQGSRLALSAPVQACCSEPWAQLD